MGTRQTLRTLRGRFAPAGTRREHWVSALLQFYGRLRQVQWPLFLWMRVPHFLRPPLRKVYRLVENTRLAPHRRAVGELLRGQGEARQVIIFAPSLAWYTQLFQRPQQLALALARQGALVFYIEPKPIKGEIPLRQMQERMYWCNFPARVFDDLRNPLVYTLTWNYGYLSIFAAPRPIYDFVDDIDVFYGDHSQMRRDHEKLIHSAAVMLVTAADLYQQVQPLRPDVLFCPNGVDWEHFAHLRQPASGPPPDDLAPILVLGRPVIGYYGALARWFDFDLLKTLASRRADLSFVLIGPDYDSTLHPSGILHLPNVHWLGVKSYAELPEYLRYFDVATIPFQLSKITHATSPLKLFEYMAGGKPVVITPMRESMRYAGVLVASTAEEFSDLLDRALVLKDDPEYQRRIETVALENTWDARARQILDALEGKRQPDTDRVEMV